MDCSNIKHVNVHKQQFDSIEQKADYLILSCIENGKENTRKGFMD